MTTENIEVTTLFSNKGLPIPKSFKYGQKIYKITSVNLAHAIRRGVKRILVFNVTDNGGDHTLIFDTENLCWELKALESF